jgi:O-antigen/teichoic acid export membrane protein
MSLLIGRKAFDIKTKYMVATNILAAVILAITLFLTNNIFLILLAYFGSHTALRFIFLLATLKKFPPNKKEDPRTISYGKHLTLTKIVGPVATHSDRILLFNFLGAPEVAIYSFALLLPDQIKNLLKPVATLAFPKFSAQPEENLKKSLMNKVFKFFLITIPITIIYLVSAPFIYKVFFPQYLDSIFYSQIFALTILLLPQVLIGTYFNAQMKKKELYILRYITPLTKIVLLLILLPILGILGAVLAMMINLVIIFGLSVFLFKRKV